MPAINAPRNLEAALETRESGPGLYLNTLYGSVGDSNHKRAEKREGAEAATFQVNQESRATDATRELGLSPHISQGYADANINNDEWVRMCEIRERNKAAERAQRASQMLQHVISSGPTGGPSLLALRLLSSTQGKKLRKGRTIYPGLKQTSNLRQSYSNSDSTRESGNGAGLTQKRTGHNPTTERFETSDLTESADIADVPEKGQRVTFVGAGIPTSNSISAGPVQRKRKRYIDGYSNEEESLGKRR
ncbi:hypothetical protein F4801DRAFT_597877 [Xylaria longipes]|nr:hypothetical protein F4801DRAFT_597877 [Xylaria longipes]